MFWVAYAYSWVYGVIKDRFGFNLPGLGFLLRRIRRDRILHVKNRAMWMNHEVASCYSRLVSGSWNEPETHGFLQYICTHLHEEVTFVDVGANVGEFAVDLAGHSSVKFVYAFEPIGPCASAIRRSLELNGFANTEVVESACGSEVGFGSLHQTKDLSNSSLHTSGPAGVSLNVPVVTLDAAITMVVGQLIILADVEGSELDVIRGAKTLIRQHHPLIIFEYNYVSKGKFSSHDVQAALGDGWDILRLRSDGRVDSQVDDAWNCVAVYVHSRFHKLIAELSTPVDNRGVLS